MHIVPCNQELFPKTFRKKKHFGNKLRREPATQIVVCVRTFATKNRFQKKRFGNEKRFGNDFRRDREPATQIVVCVRTLGPPSLLSVLPTICACVAHNNYDCAPTVPSCARPDLRSDVARRAFAFALALWCTFKRRLPTSTDCCMTNIWWFFR